MVEKIGNVKLLGTNSSHREIVIKKFKMSKNGYIIIIFETRDSEKNLPYREFDREKIWKVENWQQQKKRDIEILHTKNNVEKLLEK